MGLLDAIQAASNAAASNVSGPIDGIAWLLRKAGISVPEPVGGSDWMARQGLTKQVAPGASQVVGETLGLLGPSAIAAKAPQVAKGLLTMGENAAAPRAAGFISAQRGAINHPGAPEFVYHGSAEPFDTFDFSKLGKNTGASDADVGAHFARYRSDADLYASMAARKADDAYRLNPEFPNGWIGKFDLDIKRPLVVDEAYMPAKRVEKFLNDKIAAAKYAKQNGYDGLVYPNGTNVDSDYTAIAFTADQIKRIIGDSK